MWVQFYSPCISGLGQVQTSCKRVLSLQEHSEMLTPLNFFPLIETSILSNLSTSIDWHRTDQNFLRAVLNLDNPVEIVVILPAYKYHLYVKTFLLVNVVI